MRFIPVTVLATHITRGLPLFSGAALLLVAMFTGLMVDVSPFSPGWYDPLNALGVSVAYLGPLAVGIAATQFQQLRRSGLTAIAHTSPNSTRPQVLMLCGLGFVLLLALAAELLVLLLRSPDLAGPGRGVGWMLLLDLAVLITCVLLGAVAGWLNGSPITGPAAALIVFLWMYLFSYAEGWPARLSPIDPATFYRPFLEPNPVVYAAQTAATMAIGALAATVLFVRAPRYRLAATAVTSITALAAVGTLTDATATVQFRDPPVAPLCTEQQPPVCVWPEHQAALQKLTRASVIVHSSLGASLPTPQRIAEPGLYSRRESGLGVLHIPDYTAPLSVYVHAVAQSLVPEPACTLNGSGSEPGWRAYFDLREWATLTASPSAAQTPGPLQHVLERSAAEQQRWARKQLETIEACQ